MITSYLLSFNLSSINISIPNFGEHLLFKPIRSTWVVKLSQTCVQVASHILHCLLSRQATMICNLMVLTIVFMVITLGIALAISSVVMMMLLVDCLENLETWNSRWGKAALSWAALRKLEVPTWQIIVIQNTYVLQILFQSKFTKCYFISRWLIFSMLVSCRLTTAPLWRLWRPFTVLPFFRITASRGSFIV